MPSKTQRRSSRMAGILLLALATPFQWGCSESLAGMQDYLPLIMGAAQLVAGAADYDANNSDSNLTKESKAFAAGAIATGEELQQTRERKLRDETEFGENYEKDKAKLDARQTKLENGIKGEQGTIEKRKAELAELEAAPEGQRDQARIDAMKRDIAERERHVADWTKEKETNAETLKANAERWAKHEETMRDLRTYDQNVAADKKAKAATAEQVLDGYQPGTENKTPTEDTTEKPKT